MRNSYGADLLPPSELPEGFAYTEDFVAFVEAIEPPIEPWFVMTGTILSDYQAKVLAAYPDRKLVAFARRLDLGLFAAFDADGEGEVVVRSLGSAREADMHRFPAFGKWVAWAVAQAATGMPS